MPDQDNSPQGKDWRSASCAFRLQRAGSSNRELKTENRKSLRLVLSVSRAANAPPAPTARALTRLFERALELAGAASGRLALRSAKAAKRWVADIHIVSDAHITSLNAKHLKVRGPTDVLAFTMAELDPERRAFNWGEVVVSFETAQREAAVRGIPAEEELSRYCLHGFLHLLGYDDSTKRARRAMFQVQEQALSASVRTRAAKSAGLKGILGIQ